MPLLIGIAGGTGSGKTTVAKRIEEFFAGSRVVVLPQDAYYRSFDHLPFEERAAINYDHPDAFDTELLLSHLHRLRQGLPVERPVYDFKTHRRLPETVHVEPGDVVILEGILVLHDPRIRELLDIKIYVDTPDDLRFIRRLLRDVRERGRTMDSVVKQYLATVRLMHLEFVEPSKRYADVIIPEGGFNDVALQLLISTIERFLEGAARGSGDQPPLPLLR